MPALDISQFYDIATTNRRNKRENSDYQSASETEEEDTSEANHRGDLSGFVVSDSEPEWETKEERRERRNRIAATGKANPSRRGSPAPEVVEMPGHDKKGKEPIREPTDEVPSSFDAKLDMVASHFKVDFEKESADELSQASASSHQQLVPSSPKASKASTPERSSSERRLIRGKRPRIPNDGDSDEETEQRTAKRPSPRSTPPPRPAKEASRTAVPPSPPATTSSLPNNAEGAIPPELLAMRDSLVALGLDEAERTKLLRRALVAFVKNNATKAAAAIEQTNTATGATSEPLPHTPSSPKVDIDAKDSAGAATPDMDDSKVTSTENQQPTPEQTSTTAVGQDKPGQDDTVRLTKKERLEKKLHEIEEKKRSRLLKRKEAAHAEMLKRAKEFDIPSELFSRCRLRGRHNTILKRPREVVRTCLRLAMGIRHRRELYKIHKLYKRVLARNNVNMLVPWARQDKKLMLKVCVDILKGFQPIFPHWNLGMVRVGVRFYIGDTAKNIRRKGNNYESRAIWYDRRPPRPIAYAPDYSDEAIEKMVTDHLEKYRAHVTSKTSKGSKGAKKAKDQEGSNQNAHTGSATKSKKTAAAGGYKVKPTLSRFKIARQATVPEPSEEDEDLRPREKLPDVPFPEFTPTPVSSRHPSPDGEIPRASVLSDASFFKEPTKRIKKEEPSQQPISSPVQQAPTPPVSPLSVREKESGTQRNTMPPPPPPTPPLSSKLSKYPKSATPSRPLVSPTPHARSSLSIRAERGSVLPSDPPTQTYSQSRESGSLARKRRQLTATVRVEFVAAHNDLTNQCSFMLTLSKRHPLRTFLHAVEGMIGKAVRTRHDFLTFMPIDCEDEMWNVIKDTSDVARMVRFYGNTSGVFMTIISLDEIKRKMLRHASEEELRDWMYFSRIVKSEQDDGNSQQSDMFTVDELESITFVDVQRHKWTEGADHPEGQIQTYNHQLVYEDMIEGEDGKLTSVLMEEDRGEIEDSQEVEWERTGSSKATPVSRDTPRFATPVGGVGRRSGATPIPARGALATLLPHSRATSRVPTASPMPQRGPSRSSGAISEYRQPSVSGGHRLHPILRSSEPNCGTGRGSMYFEKSVFSPSAREPSVLASVKSADTPVSVLNAFPPTSTSTLVHRPNGYIPKEFVPFEGTNATTTRHPTSSPLLTLTETLARRRQREGQKALEEDHQVQRPSEPSKQERDDHRRQREAQEELEALRDESLEAERKQGALNSSTHPQLPPRSSPPLKPSQKQPENTQTEWMRFFGSDPLKVPVPETYECDDSLLACAPLFDESRKRRGIMSSQSGAGPVNGKTFNPLPLPNDAPGTTTLSQQGLFGPALQPWRNPNMSQDGDWSLGVERRTLKEAESTFVNSRSAAPRVASPTTLSRPREVALKLLDGVADSFGMGENIASDKHPDRGKSIPRPSAPLKRKILISGDELTASDKIFPTGDDASFGYQRTQINERVIPNAIRRQINKITAEVRASGPLYLRYEMDKQLVESNEPRPLRLRAAVPPNTPEPIESLNEADTTPNHVEEPQHAPAPYAPTPTVSTSAPTNAGDRPGSRPRSRSKAVPQPHRPITRSQTRIATAEAQPDAPAAATTAPIYLSYTDIYYGILGLYENHRKWTDRMKTGARVVEAKFRELSATETGTFDWEPLFLDAIKDYPMKKKDYEWEAQRAVILAAYRNKNLPPEQQIQQQSASSVSRPAIAGTPPPTFTAVNKTAAAPPSKPTGAIKVKSTIRHRK
ncbi:hypothetical protein BJ508DRAFT_335918 [Ascobolus immersus RN42]|uniref:Uncharacterized protein n=1 Tax=Ascobolus immersus RN42 TaxID=1160509 RepID=A0A3N4HPG5_ASCIM|nr:hypothetical protein BJ508DRAFT_335918 [Ascobolus immersus RN42]